MVPEKSVWDCRKMNTKNHRFRGEERLDSTARTGQTTDLWSAMEIPERTMTMRSGLQMLLEVNLAPELHRSARLRIALPRLDHACDLTKLRAIAEIPIWIGEVRVVEGVVSLQANFNVARGALGAKRKV